MSGGHHHDHAHDHAEPRPEYARLERAVRELMIAKGLLTAADIRRQIERLDSRGRATGAKIVARAWVDPAFKKRLLADAKKATEEFGVDTSNAATVVALENTPERHHVVVCTLCSCYPKAILGAAPAWYKSSAYRARARSKSRARFWRSSAPCCPKTWKSAWSIRPPTCAIW
jgi:nitrile hydratase